MHNPYKAKQALLAASFVAVSSLAACNNNPSLGEGGAEPRPSVNPAPVPEAIQQTSAAGTSRIQGQAEEVPEVSVNPAPPTQPEPTTRQTPEEPSTGTTDPEEPPTGPSVNPAPPMS